MKSYRDIIDLLLARRLLPRSAVIQDGFRIEDMSRRNCNMRLETAQGRGYFIKIGMDVDRRITLEQEAQAYRFLHVHAPQTKLLPEMCMFDRHESVLALELLSRENLKSL